MTDAQTIQRNRKWMRRERERGRRAADRALLRQLREALRDAKRVQRDRRREVVLSCQRARAMVRERAKLTRAQARAAAQAAIDEERQRSRSVCEVEKARAREAGRTNIGRALQALEAERRHQAHARLYQGPARLPGQRKPRRGIEAIQESDAEVEANLPADLVGVWRAVRRRIKAKPRASRTEAFLEWAAENSAEVARLQDAQLQRDIDELVRREAELREQSGDASYYRGLSDAELDAVPF